MLASEFSDHYRYSVQMLEEAIATLIAQSEVTLPNRGAKLRTRMKSSSSLPKPHLADIFINLPPNLRCIYDNLEKDFRFYVECLKLDGGNSELKSNVEGVMLKIRKLCVDSSLVELEETPVTQFLEGICSVLGGYPQCTTTVGFGVTQPSAVLQEMRK
ncbi:hypothetical protein A2U01_0018347 [Trifolium medium]|uniref:Uncharacterized protein n=1 Tax=Trifolium medium TaxID=97028 RepID=A0A392NDE7_9FABA|nr:hypothetical protein [Trifolium medium]